MSTLRDWPARAVLRAAAALSLATVVFAAVPRALEAQWSTTYESFYLQAPHNWVFRNQYQAADRLFNAFDYGHSILYETLFTEPNAPASRLEEREYNFLTKKVLVQPPRLPLEETAIEPNYARLAPEAKVMFDWAHILHRQIYDVLADERLSQPRKDAEVQRLIAYYKTRPDLAFSSKPKSMALMQEQPYSLAFRKEFPKFNGLIWGYHWLQVGLYEPLMTGASSQERQAGVRATVARFWQMLQDAPRTLPYQMPMTAAVSPVFTARYPEAAIIFDNLHSMHDVISDILANDSVPGNRKRAEIMLAARRYRDDTSFVMPVAAWKTMSMQMGIENMGGSPVAFLSTLPTPTVSRGAVMVHDEQTGQMIGVKYGSVTGAHGNMAGMDHAGTNMPPVGAKPAGAPAMDHAAMPGMRMAADSGMSRGMMAGMSREMMEMHMRMMADSVIRRRVLADTAMRRMMMGMLDQLPAEHRDMMREMMGGQKGMNHGTMPEMNMPGMNMPAKKPATRKSPSKKAPVKKAAVKDSMAGMDHSKMTMPKKP